jgi:transposase
MIDRIDAGLDPIVREIARRFPFCTVLQREWDVGVVLSTTILAELGDTQGFEFRQAVRFAGLSLTVHASDAKPARVTSSGQGSPILHWALYKATGGAWCVGSPDREYYLEVKERLGPMSARLSVARRMLRWKCHELAEAGDSAFAKDA